MRKLLLGVMLVSGAALAQQQTFAALDTNGDGQLSFSEAFSHPQLSNNFNALDSNADGLLSRGEVAGIIR
jgi:Ca2+-binding EF-hand superfamily protein